MRNILLLACVAGTLAQIPATHCCADGRPYEQGRFRGRIAWSADGNHNDPDDWAASPVALAIIAECGGRDRLVHFDYNCILPATDPKWEKTHAESVLGAAQRYGYNRSVFHDCRQDLEGALDSIAQAIDASTADNPLYFVVAGPMEVPFRGIQKSDPEKRKHVYCISHSRWNDGYARRYTFTNTKRSVISSGVHWVQIGDQNRLLSTSPYGQATRPEHWRPYQWMRDSADPKVRFLWERMEVSTRPDPSDAGMAYFLMTGDEEADPAKLKRLLNDNVVPTPVGTRKRVRLEAENFRDLDGYEVEDRNDRQASHALGVKLAGANAGRIRTPFDEPYTATRGRYDVEVRYFDEPQHPCKFTLLINGDARGPGWESSGTGAGWMTQTVRDVEIRNGDEIRVDAQGTPGRLDYVQLDDRGPATAQAPPR
jgi:hypothetical protein